MARMYGAYARPWCSSCHRSSGLDCPNESRTKRSQRRYEERQWRRDWAQDIDDVEEELRLLDFVEKTWLPRWYVERFDPIWVRL